MKLADRILLLLATLLAKLTGLDELLDAIVLPLAFIEYSVTKVKEEELRKMAEELKKQTIENLKIALS